MIENQLKPFGIQIRISLAFLELEYFIQRWNGDIKIRFIKPHSVE